MSDKALRDEEKKLKEKILMSSIEEFGKKGYEAASTNEIVKNAKVSKGLLFHYYKNKNNLYLESLIYVMNSFAEYMEANFDFSDSDVFARMRNIVIEKLNFCRMCPSFTGLMEKSWYYDSKERVPGLTELFEENVEAIRQKVIWNKFYKNLDMDSLKNGLDMVKIVEYTYMAIEAVWQRFTKAHNENMEDSLNDLDAFIIKMDEIIDIMKYGAYRK